MEVWVGGVQGQKYRGALGGAEYQLREAVEETKTARAPAGSASWTTSEPEESQINPIEDSLSILPLKALGKSQLKATILSMI
jgi:hypothetical protein